ncbi:MAG: diacylglycerol kinase [bacterium]
MGFFNIRILAKSFRFAWRGLSTAFKNEQNFRVQLIAAIIILALIVILPLATWEIVALIMITTLVLILELINSIFEKLADILEPRIHSYVRVIKDLMAATVLIASIVSVIIGLIILLPHFYILNIFK